MRSLPVLSGVVTKCHAHCKVNARNKIGDLNCTSTIVVTRGSPGTPNRVQPSQN